MVSSRSIFQYGIALLSITLILPMVTDAATPPTPPGFNTGGIFADYFLNAVNRSVAPSPSTSTAFDCPQDTYLYGFEGTPGGYMTKRCRSAVYLQAWTVAGNTTTNADFF